MKIRRYQKVKLILLKEPCQVRWYGEIQHGLLAIRFSTMNHPFFLENIIVLTRLSWNRKNIYIYISYTASIDYCLVNLSDWYVLRYWTPEAKLYTALQNKAVLLSGSQRSCIRRRRQHVTQSTHPACLAQSRLESRGGETMFSSQASIQGLGPTRIAPNDCHFNNVLWLVECAQTW